jgi:hypothetical protein
MIKKFENVHCLLGLSLFEVSFQNVAFPTQSMYATCLAQRTRCNNIWQGLKPLALMLLWPAA